MNTLWDQYEHTYAVISNTLEEDPVHSLAEFSLPECKQKDT
jgi:hypothetical protein